MNKHNNQVCIVEDMFLNKSEIDYVFNFVFDNRDKWFSKHISDNNTPTKNTFPIGLYETERSNDLRNLYYDSLTHNRRMFEVVLSHTYEKIRQTVSDIFECDINYHSNFNYPGFHIFSNNTDSIVKHKKINYHLDGFSLINDKNDIYSFVIPIRMPFESSGLFYMKNNTIKKLKYKEGMLGMWYGKILHSIDNFILKDTQDYRVTMQFHVCLKRDIGYIFW
jgi:hypothetical protein